MTVEQDGVPLTAAERRARCDNRHQARRAVIALERARLYNIVRNREFGEHLLTLRPQDPGSAVYSLTGVAAVIPDLISSN